MDKQKAIERVRYVEEKIELARAEVQELRKIIDTPEPAGALLTNLEPGSGRKYWTLGATSRGKLVVLCCCARVNDPAFYDNGALFQTEALADSYSDAINTMLLLRHQPGTEPAGDNAQYLIEMMRKDDKLQVKVIGRTDAASKMNKLSPCFDTFVHAVEAVETLGVPRLQRMFKTLHHIEG